MQLTARVAGAQTSRHFTGITPSRRQTVLQEAAVALKGKLARVYSGFWV